MSANSLAFIVFDGVDDLDLFGCASVISKAGDAEHPPLGIKFVAIGGKSRVTTALGAFLDCHLLRDTDLSGFAGVVIPGGRVAAEVVLSEAEADRLSRQMGGGVPTYLICSGAFIPANAGLLAGRKVACHEKRRAAMARLTARKPAIGIVTDGSVISIGGCQSNGTPKSIAMGFLVISTLRPHLVGIATERLEIALSIGGN